MAQMEGGHSSEGGLGLMSFYTTRALQPQPGG
jgi:hypothetical protein